MTFFFQARPIVIQADVRTTVDGDLKDNYSLDLLSHQDTTVVPDAVVPLPALKATNWNWLQPYYASSVQPRVEFNALKIKQTDAAIQYDPGPYTAVEGYLQLAKPLLRPEILQKNPPARRSSSKLLQRPQTTKLPHRFRLPPNSRIRPDTGPQQARQQSTRPAHHAVRDSDGSHPRSVDEARRSSVAHVFAHRLAQINQLVPAYKLGEENAHAARDKHSQA